MNLFELLLKDNSQLSQDVSIASVRRQGPSTIKQSTEPQKQAQKTYNQAPYDLYEEAQSAARMTSKTNLNLSQNSIMENSQLKRSQIQTVSPTATSRSFPVRSKLDQEIEELSVKADRASPIRGSNRAIVIPTDGQNNFRIKEIRNPIFDNKRKLNGVNTSSIEFKDISTTPGLITVPNRVIAQGGNDSS